MIKIMFLSLTLFASLSYSLCFSLSNFVSLSYSLCFSLSNFVSLSYSLCFSLSLSLFVLLTDLLTDLKNKELSSSITLSSDDIMLFRIQLDNIKFFTGRSEASFFFFFLHNFSHLSAVPASQVTSTFLNQKTAIDYLPHCSRTLRDGEQKEDKGK